MKPVLFALLTCLCTTAHAQKLTILAEHHGIKEATIQKRLLMQQLYDSNNVHDLVMECGTSTAYLFNRYIQTGDTAAYDMIYLNNPNGNRTHTLRELYLQGNKITVHGIDFERPDFIPALKYLFEQKGATNNRLYSYLVSLSDTSIALRKHDELRKERANILKNCKAVYKDSAAYYNTVEQDGYSAKAVFENPASEMRFSQRDDAMHNNLKPVLANAKGNLLMIVGRMHGEGELYKYITKDMLQPQDVMLMSMLCRNCKVSAMYFEDRRVPYLGNKNFTADTAAVDKLFDAHHRKGRLNLVRTDTPFWATHPSFKEVEKINQIMLVDCEPE